MGGFILNIIATIERLPMVKLTGSEKPPMPIGGNY
jgi:hypothetical protein